MWTATTSLSKQIPTYISSTIGTQDFLATTNDLLYLEGLPAFTAVIVTIEFNKNQHNSHYIFENTTPNLEILDIYSSSISYQKKDITHFKSSDTALVSYFNSLYNREKLNTVTCMFKANTQTYCHYKASFSEVKGKGYPIICATHPDLYQIIVLEPLSNFKTVMSASEFSNYKFTNDTIIEFEYKSLLYSLDTTKHDIFNFLTNPSIYNVTALSYNQPLENSFISYRGRIYSRIESASQVAKQTFFKRNTEPYIYFIE